MKLVSFLINHQVVKFRHSTDLTETIFLIVRNCNIKIGMNITANKLYHFNNIFGLNMLLSITRNLQKFNSSNMGILECTFQRLWTASQDGLGMTGHEISCSFGSYLQCPNTSRYCELCSWVIFEELPIVLRWAGTDQPWDIMFLMGYSNLD